MELDYHTPEEYKSMNLEISYKAREIIDAHIKGQPIMLRYKGIGGSWFPLTGTAHLNWNFAKYEYKIDNKDKTKSAKNIEVLSISALMGEAIKRISKHFVKYRRK